MGWAGEHGLSVRWRPGDNWAIVEGEAEDVGAAFGVAVHDFRGAAGRCSTPPRSSLRCPRHCWCGHRPRPDPRLHAVSRSRPSSARRTCPIRADARGAAHHLQRRRRWPTHGYTGKGTTIVVFAFDGFDQADLDMFATTYNLPKFTPEVVGGHARPNAPARPRWISRWRTRSRRTPARCWSTRGPPSSGGGAYVKIGADDGGRPTGDSPARLEFLDRLGLRQADHRGRPGSGPVRVGRGRTRMAPRRSTPAVTSPAWNAKAATTGRPRPARPTSGWTSSRRCPR